MLSRSIGVIASANIYGANERITFEAFVVNKLVPQLWRGACVVMDNSTIHKGESIQAAIEAVGARLVFLSPYSPEFNPIEHRGVEAQKHSSFHWC